MSDILDLDKLLNGLDGGTPPAPAPTPAPTPTPTPAPVPPVTDPAPVPPVTDPAPTDPAPAPPADDKTHLAFAAMRVENTQMKRVLQQLGTALNVDISDPNKLNEALTNMANNKIANNQGIPPQVLQELESLRSQVQQNNQYARVAELDRQVGQLVKDFGVADADISAFITEQTSKGIDLMGTNINLVELYKQQNFEKILAARVAAEVAKVQQQVNNAGQFSSPGSTAGTGSPGTSGATVNTVLALDALLNQQGLGEKVQPKNAYTFKH